MHDIHNTHFYMQSQGAVKLVAGAAGESPLPTAQDTAPALLNSLASLHLAVRALGRARQAPLGEASLQQFAKPALATPELLALSLLVDRGIAALCSTYAGVMSSWAFAPQCAEVIRECLEAHQQ
jgi:hypothetical protein